MQGCASDLSGNVIEYVPSLIRIWNMVRTPRLLEHGVQLLGNLLSLLLLLVLEMTGHGTYT